MRLRSLKASVLYSDDAPMQTAESDYASDLNTKWSGDTVKYFTPPFRIDGHASEITLLLSENSHARMSNDITSRSKDSEYYRMGNTYGIIVDLSTPTNINEPFGDDDIAPGAYISDRPIVTYLNKERTISIIKQFFTTRHVSPGLLSTGGEELVAKLFTKNRLANLMAVPGTAADYLTHRELADLWLRRNNDGYDESNRQRIGGLGDDKMVANHKPNRSFVGVNDYVNLRTFEHMNINIYAVDGPCEEDKGSTSTELDSRYWFHNQSSLDDGDNRNIWYELRLSSHNHTCGVHELYVHRVKGSELNKLFDVAGIGKFIYNNTFNRYFSKPATEGIFDSVKGQVCEAYSDWVKEYVMKKQYLNENNLDNFHLPNRNRKTISGAALNRGCTRVGVEYRPNSMRLEDMLMSDAVDVSPDYVNMERYKNGLDAVVCGRYLGREQHEYDKSYLGDTLSKCLIKNSVDNLLLFYSNSDNVNIHNNGFGMMLSSIGESGLNTYRSWQIEVLSDTNNGKSTLLEQFSDIEFSSWRYLQNNLGIDRKIQEPRAGVYEWRMIGRKTVYGGYHVEYTYDYLERYSWEECDLECELQAVYEADLEQGVDPEQLLIDKIKADELTMRFTPYVSKCQTKIFGGDYNLLSGMSFLDSNVKGYYMRNVLEPDLVTPGSVTIEGKLSHCKKLLGETVLREALVRNCRAIEMDIQSVLQLQARKMVGSVDSSEQEKADTTMAQLDKIYSAAQSEDKNAVGQLLCYPGATKLKHYLPYIIYLDSQFNYLSAIIRNLDKIPTEDKTSKESLDENK